MIVHDETARIAEAILAFRLERHAHLPKELFSEVPWDFLLELFLADAAGKQITGRQIAEKIDASEVVASRWLKHLSALGLVIGDGHGDLDDLLTISADGIEKIESILAYAVELLRGIAILHRVKPGI